MAENVIAPKGAGWLGRKAEQPVVQPQELKVSGWAQKAM